MDVTHRWLGESLMMGYLMVLTPLGVQYGTGVQWCKGVPDGVGSLGVPTPGVDPALGQEAVLVLCLQVLGRFKPAAPSIVLQALAVEHGLVCGGLPSHFCRICLVLGHLAAGKTLDKIVAEHAMCSWSLG